MFKLVVLSSVLALTAAAPSGLGLHGWGLGLGWGGALAGHLGSPLAAPLAAPLARAHWGSSWGSPWGAAPVAHGHGGIASAPAIAAYNYRGPLSLAPGQPANILAQDGRPLDTINVNLDRVAHITAKALDPAGGHGAHGHLIGKRSAPLLGGAWSHSARLDLPAAPLAISAAPVGIHGGYGLGPVAPLGLGAWGHGGNWGHWGGW